MGLPPDPALAFHEILHEKIALPKSKTAKNVSVPREIFIQAQELATLLIQQSNNLATQLCTKVDILLQQLNPTKPTYAAIAARTATEPRQATTNPTKPPKSKLEITLTQTDHKHPTFASDTMDDIRRQFNSTMSRLKLVSPDTDQSIVARAVIKLRNGNIKLVMRSEDDRNTLLQSPLIWVSHLSPKLEVARPSYKVIVHGVLTTYNPDDSDSLLDAIEKEKPFMAEFTTSWISRQPHAKVTAAKTHSSVVLH